MKLNYDTRFDQKKLNALVRTLLKAEKGSRLSGFTARHLFNDKYGIDIDHHEMAYRLDEMTRTGEARFAASNGGDTMYEIL